jgi:hypothetical protein
VHIYRTVVIASSEPSSAQDFGEYRVAENSKTLVVVHALEYSLVRCGYLGSSHLNGLCSQNLLREVVAGNGLDLLGGDLDALHVVRVVYWCLCGRLSE